MFRRTGNIICSDIFTYPNVHHGFATRAGGVSAIPEVASMNTAVRMGDTRENVEENVARLATYIGMDGCRAVYSRQVHSTDILEASPEDALTDPEERDFDGYVTKCSGVPLLVRAADCVPVLFAGICGDGSPIIGAAHAGWKGTVLGIAPMIVRKMCELGATKDTIRIAVGPSIHECCFEVKEDFIDSVSELAGKDFAWRHIREKDGRYFASLQDMNRELLSDEGICAEHIDICTDCTAHMSDVYHSHRATKGLRGTGGGMIGIK